MGGSSSSGNIEISTPRDRLSSFEPEIVKKRETIMAQTLVSIRSVASLMAGEGVLHLPQNSKKSRSSLI